MVRDRFKGTMHKDITAFKLLFKGKYLVFLILSIFLFALAFRVTSAVVAALMIIFLITLPFHRNIKMLSIIWYIFLFFSILPVDITFINYPGPPKIVPYIKGLPSRDLMVDARRGEVVLGGCVITGYHPRWVVVW